MSMVLLSNGNFANRQPKKVGKVEVKTEQYEFSHGKQPRGFGNWFFCPAEHYGKLDYFNHCYALSQQTYTSAKLNAMKLAKMKGVSSLVVCP